MGTTRCRDDDGDCSYPDRALMMVNGRLSVVTADAAERISRLDDSGGDAEPLETTGPFSYHELVDLVLEARRSESPDNGAFGRTFAAESRQRLASVESAMASESSDDWLIVYCSPCGHIWRKRIP